MNFFHKFLLKIRSNMCLKELEWYVEEIDEIKKGALFLISAMFTKDFSQEDCHVLYNPTCYSVDTNHKFYIKLELTRNSHDQQLQHIKRNLVNLGMKFPKYSEDHMIMCSKSIDVWLCTLASNLNGNRSYRTKKIWDIFPNSIASLTESIHYLREIESRTASDLNEEGTSMFNIEKNEWLKLCEIKPVL